MKPITRTDAIKTVQFQIDILIDSFTNRIGGSKGRITNRSIIREIRCLKHAIKLLRKS